MTWRAVELASDTFGFAQRPACGPDGTIAVGYSAPAPEPGAEPVVGVLDADGSPGFTIRHVGAGREIETCAPCIDEARVVRTAVYEHDVELAIYAAYTDGTLLPRTSLGSAYPLHASDAGSKLRTQIAACASGGFVVTWCYRAREFFVGHYRDGSATASWSAEEWMIGATRDHVLCALPSPRAPATEMEPRVCRRKADGAVAWELPAGVVDLAATVDDAVLVVDRTQRFAEKRAINAQTEQQFLDGAITEAEVERAWDRMPTAPTVVRVLDAATGRERSRMDIPDDVFSAHLSRDGLVSVMTTDAAGRGQLYTNRATVPRAIAGHASSSWPPASLAGEPVIVDHVGDHVVWGDEVNLHVARADALERAVSVVLPASLGGFRPRMRDRSIALANAIIASGHLYLRAGATLWIGELPALP